MWKDFFYYSKGERRAVYLLLILIALLLLGITLIPEDKPVMEPKVSQLDSLKSETTRSTVLTF